MLTKDETTVLEKSIPHLEALARHWEGNTFFHKLFKNTAKDAQEMLDLARKVS